eukprot:6320318-Alexandrium_andersonii.AAC.1
MDIGRRYVEMLGHDGLADRRFALLLGGHSLGPDWRAGQGREDGPLRAAVGCLFSLRFQGLRGGAPKAEGAADSGGP